LRTPEEPDGVSDLEGVELERVRAANILYAFTVEVLEKCCQLKILCMIENPRHNLFWFVTVWIVRTSNRVIPYLLSVIDDMNTSRGALQDRETNGPLQHLLESTTFVLCAMQSKPFS
jgi:hypothetical protein